MGDGKTRWVYAGVDDVLEKDELDDLDKLVDVVTAGLELEDCEDVVLVTAGDDDGALLDAVLLATVDDELTTGATMGGPE